jgi:hypothetical protein
MLFGLLLAAPARAQSMEPLRAERAAGHFELGLHARSMQASARSEQAAWLTLTVPFDRLAAPRVVTASAPPGATPSPPGFEPLPNAAAPAASPPLLLSFEQLHAISDFLQRAVGVAARVAGAAVDRGRLDSLSSRARASALLPELRLRALRNSDQALRWLPSADDPSRITQSDAAGVVLEASATFRLDRLVFAHEELAVERLRQRAAEERLKLEARVAQAVLELVRARQQACGTEPNDPARTGPLLKLQELFELLDALTAGWFGGQAPGLGQAVWGYPEAILARCEPPDPPPPPPPPAKPIATNPVASLTDSE